MKSEIVYSIILTNYNQEKYIYGAIDSILSQNYEGIELLIIDDHSVEFDKSKLSKYIKIKKNKNLTNFEIIVNSKNLGTVKTLNKALRNINGKYVSFLAADDTLYDEDVIRKCVREFQKTKSSMIVFKTKMMDDKLKNEISDFPSDDVSYINNISSGEQFKVIAKGAIFASGAVTYKKSLFSKYKISEKYELVEDWPFHLYLTRMGEKFHYINKYSLKHRAGGISEKAVANKKIISKITKDISLTYKKEIFPYIKMLTEEEKTIIYDGYKYNLLRRKGINYLNYLYNSLRLKFKG